MYDEYIDEIELEYTMFLAEQELFDNLIFLGSSVHHESVGLMIIEEDFKDSVNKYVEKIVTGIQKAWNTFKTKVIEAAVKPIIDNAKAKVDGYDGTVVVNFWHKYDMNKLDAVSMVDFDINLLESCQNKTEYYSKAFGSIFVDKEKSLKNNIIDQVVTTEEGDHTITNDEMSGMVDFCVRRFKEACTKLESDIDKMNKNVNKVRYTLKVTEPGEEGGEQSATSQSVEPTKESSLDILTGIYESCLLTEEENNDTKSVKVVDKGNAGGGNKGGNLKYVNWYLAGNTDVFSAKMKILRLRYLDCIKIFKAAFPMEKKKEEKNTVEVKKETKYQLKK